MRKNLVSAQVNLESDAVFEQIKLYVTGNPEQVKSVKGVFVYNITEKGAVKGVWSELIVSLNLRLFDYF